MIFTIFMCRCHELSDIFPINRTTTSHKGKQQCQRQGRTAEDWANEWLFYERVKSSIGKSSGSHDPEDSLLSIFLSYCYISLKGKRSSGKTYVMYNHSFWDIFDYYISDVVIWFTHNNERLRLIFTYILSII